MSHLRPLLCGTYQSDVPQTFGNQFTDTGVQQLVALQDFEQLYLEEPTLSVTAFDIVIGLPRLRTLGVQGVSLTENELEVLPSRLPQARARLKLACLPRSVPIKVRTFWRR